MKENESEMNVRFRIGDRIKELRLEQRLSLQALADMTNVTKANLSKIENGKCSAGIDVLDRIARP